jgi:hypothetical protein
MSEQSALPNPYNDNDKTFSSFYNIPRHQQDGRVEIGNQCITMQDDEKLALLDCVDSPEQEWQFSNYNIIHRDSGKCLDNGTPMELVECDLNNRGSFIDTEEQDIKNPSWNKKFGKNVVLVSADNPWYINTNTTEIMEHKPYPAEGEYRIDNYKPFATFEVKQKQPTMKTQPELGVEYFGNIFTPLSHEERVVNFICYLLIIIIVIQLIYLYFKKK